MEWIVQRVQQQQHGRDDRYDCAHQESLNDGSFPLIGEEQHVNEDQPGYEEQHNPQRRRDDADRSVDAIVASRLTIRRLTEPRVECRLLGGGLRIDRPQRLK